MNVFLKADLKNLVFVPPFCRALCALGDGNHRGILGTEPRPYHHQHHPGDEP